MANESPRLEGIPGGDPESPHRPVSLWLQLAVAVVLFVFCAWVEIDLVILAAGAHGHRGSSRAGQIVGAIIFLLIIYGAARWIEHAEHRLRRGQPAARAWEEKRAGTGLTQAPTGRRVRRGRGRSFGPVGTGVVTGVFALAFAGAVIGAIICFNQAQRSSYVQAHGTSAGATVQNVDNTQSCGRYSCSWSAAIKVSFSPPVDGVRSSVVHYPGYSDLLDGDPVTVLVDPKQPGYAELPGDPFVSAIDWIVLAVLALLAALVTYEEGKHLRVLLVHRQAVRDAAAAAPMAKV